MKNKNSPVLFVAFSHKLTESQLKGFAAQYGNFEVVTLSEVAPELQKQMSNISPMATLSEIQELARLIIVEAVKVKATHFFCTGEPTLTMWANLYASEKIEYPYKRPYLVKKGRTESSDRWGVVYVESEGEMLALTCVQSTTERNSVEVNNPDGTVTKKQIFKHVQWREMF